MRGLLKYSQILFLSIFIIAIKLEYNAQNPIVDSLKNYLKNAQQDTVKFKLLVSLSEECEIQEILFYAENAIKLADKIIQNTKDLSDAQAKHILNLKAHAINNIGFYYQNDGYIQKALECYSNSLKIQLHTNDKYGAAESLNNIGLIYGNQGNISKALYNFEKSLKLNEEVNNKAGIATTLMNTGIIYQNQGDIAKALNTYEKSLQIQEETHNKGGMASSLNNLGTIFFSQGDLTKALIYFERSLELYKAIDDKHNISSTFSNIGIIYKNQGDKIKALNYFKKALKIQEDVNEKAGIAHSLNNIASLNFENGEHEQSLLLCARALKLRKEINDNEGVANSFNFLGDSYYKIANSINLKNEKQKNYRLAYSYADSSLKISKKLGFPENIMKAEKTLSKIDSANGNYKEAFEHFKHFIIYRDSIYNEGNRKAIIKNQLKYEYDKKEAIIKLQQEKERVIANEKNRFQQIVIWSVFIGFLIVIVFAAFIFRNLNTTRKQKLIIEEKQKEILDSIRYAKRIQQSLLPNDKYISKNLMRLQKK
ncbi:MAG: tetratricopeptide repeat protein [Bacteroidota bacterium]|nr:tetratricopeptide repeat protein [Bacteroidota bacterium]MDP3145968.1 tetratricopeptide repeat protein [Bacteroidota bacterium]MDP3558603.1 tetratricopeptide repeat protein [Bacteroidota bacterium]